MYLTYLICTRTSISSSASPQKVLSALSSNTTQTYASAGSTFPLPEPNGHLLVTNFPCNLLVLDRPAGDC